MTGLPCGCALVVRDYLVRAARIAGLEAPMPHADHCTACHGVFTDAEMEERGRWMIALFQAIKKSKKGNLQEKDRETLKALLMRYGGAA